MTTPVRPASSTFGEALGHHSQEILAGLRINDGKGAYVAGRMVKAMLQRRIQVDGAQVLAFKENRADLRKLRVIVVVAELRDFGVTVDVCDPWVDAGEVPTDYRLTMLVEPEIGAYDGALITVAHRNFCDIGAERMRRYGMAPSMPIDLRR